MNSPHIKKQSWEKLRITYSSLKKSQYKSEIKKRYQKLGSKSLGLLNKMEGVSWENPGKLKERVRSTEQLTHCAIFEEPKVDLPLGCSAQHLLHWTATPNLQSVKEEVMLQLVSRSSET